LGQGFLPFFLRIRCPALQHGPIRDDPFWFSISIQSNRRASSNSFAVFCLSGFGEGLYSSVGPHPRVLVGGGDFPRQGWCLCFSRVLGVLLLYLYHLASSFLRSLLRRGSLRAETFSPPSIFTWANPRFPYSLRDARPVPFPKISSPTGKFCPNSGLTGWRWRFISRDPPLSLFQSLHAPSIKLLYTQFTSPSSEPPPCWLTAFD